MYPNELIHIGDHEFLTLYGIMIAIGVILAILLLKILAKKVLGTTKRLLDFTETTAYAAVLFGFLGAALFQDFYNFLDTGTWRFFSGITFLGGLISGAVIFFVIYFVRKKTLDGRLVDILPAVPPCICIAHGFGRLGCMFAGCCYGEDVNVAIEKGLWPKFLQNFYCNMSASGHSAQAIPTQLMEAIFLFLLCGVMVLLLLKKKHFNMFPIYLASYGVWRFFIEIVRADSRGKFIGNITPSQFWSILMVILCVPVFIIVKKLTYKFATIPYIKELSAPRKIKGCQ